MKADQPQRGVRFRLKSVRFFVYNMIRVGPPGAGKTLLARALPGVLPEIMIDEALDVTRICSVAEAAVGRDDRANAAIRVNNLGL